MPLAAAISPVAVPNAPLAAAISVGIPPKVVSAAPANLPACCKYGAYAPRPPALPIASSVNLPKPATYCGP